jgi:hypothetical protein
MDQLHPSGEKLFLSVHPRFIKSWEEPAGRGEVSSCAQTTKHYLPAFFSPDAHYKNV